MKKNIQNLIHRIKGERLVTRWIILGCDPCAFHGWHEATYKTEAEAKAEVVRLNAKNADFGLEYITYSVQTWAR